MSTAKFIIDSLVYSDEDATNDPLQRDWSYKKTINVTSLTKPSSQKLSLTAGGDTVITIPANPSNWIYIETDQQIKVKFNASAETVVDVSPSAAGTSDGVLFKRGAFTALTINVPGATAANVTIFMGV